MKSERQKVKSLLDGIATDIKRCRRYYINVTCADRHSIEDRNKNHLNNTLVRCIYNLSRVLGITL